MSKAQTGIIAFGIVGAVFVIFGLGIGAIVIASNVKPTDEPQTPARLNQPTNATDTSAAVRNHKWWSKPPTEKQLDDLLTLIVNTNAGNWIHVRRDRKTAIQSDQSQDLWPFPELPLEEGQRLIIHVEGLRRWSREEALRHIAVSLDSAEFHGGPAKH